MLEGSSLDVAAIRAGAVAALVTVPWFWLVGVLHFGFVSGPDPTYARYASYLVWSAPAGIGLFAWLFKTRLERNAAHRLSYARACLVAAGTVAPVLVASAVVILYSLGRDGVVVGTGLALAVLVLLTLTRLLADGATAQSNSY